MSAIPYGVIRYAIWHAQCPIAFQFPDFMRIKTFVGIGYLQFTLQDFFQTINHHLVIG
ncbi:hypothetical protein D3C79_1092170 [compost metagenome]